MIRILQPERNQGEWHFSKNVMIFHINYDFFGIMYSLAEE